MRYLAIPRGFSPVKKHADKSRGGIGSLWPVDDILSMGREAKVFPAVIEAITIFMVNETVGGRIHYLTVHIDGYGLTRTD